MITETTFACDLALSAVGSDGGFVAELRNELATRLESVPVWNDDAAGSGPSTLLSAEHSRVALVLHQHLWRHDARTIADATVLRERLSARRGSVCVLRLDDTPVPNWLSHAPGYDITELGRAGTAEFVIGVVADAGGAVRANPAPAAIATAPSRWPEPAARFLTQPRAQSALRHELDGIAAVLKRETDRARAAAPERPFELRVLPHRVIARLDDMAITFSWVPGSSSSVADGRLMVIAWRGVASGVSGVAALRSASPLHERVYVADGNVPEEWCWRAEDAARQPYASAQLVADWLARAFIARAG